MGEANCVTPQPRQPARTVGDRRCGRPRPGHPRRAHVELGQLRLLAARPDRRSAPDGRHLVPHGEVPVPRQGQGRRRSAPQRGAQAVRQLRHRRQRDERRSTWRPAPSRSPTMASTTTRTTSSVSSRCDGTGSYKHYSAGRRCSTARSRSKTIDVLKNVLTNPTRTGRRFPLDGRPAAGKTGTQDNNTNAWFVGFTPQLTTAVWVGNPNGYVPMVEYPRVQPVRRRRTRSRAARIPEMLWKAYMDPAHAGPPVEDWSPPPAPARPAGAAVPAGHGVRQADRRLRPRRARLRQPTGRPNGGDGLTGPTGQAGSSRQRLADADHPPAEPPGTEPGAALRQHRRRNRASQGSRARPPMHHDDRAPPPQTAYVPIYEDVTATTIPPDVLDPNAPLPTIRSTEYVSLC